MEAKNVLKYPAVFVRVSAKNTVFHFCSCAVVVGVVLKQYLDKCRAVPQAVPVEGRTFQSFKHFGFLAYFVLDDWLRKKPTA